MSDERESEQRKESESEREKGGRVGEREKAHDIFGKREKSV